MSHDAMEYSSTLAQWLSDEISQLDKKQGNMELAASLAFCLGQQHNTVSLNQIQHCLVLAEQQQQTIPKQVLGKLYQAYGKCLECQDSSAIESFIQLPLTSSMDSIGWAQGAMAFLSNPCYHPLVEQQLWAMHHTGSERIQSSVLWAIARTPAKSLHIGLNADRIMEKLPHWSGEMQQPALVILGKSKRNDFAPALIHYASDTTLALSTRIGALQALQKCENWDRSSLIPLIEAGRYPESLISIELVQHHLPCPAHLNWRINQTELVKLDPDIQLAFWGWDCINGTDSLGEKLWNQYTNTLDPYQRMKFMPSMAQVPSLYSKLCHRLTHHASTYVDLYYGTEALIAQSHQSAFSGDFLFEIAGPMWNTNDIGVQSLLAPEIASYLSKHDLPMQRTGWVSRMKGRLLTLQIPLEIETYNEIAKALTSMGEQTALAQNPPTHFLNPTDLAGQELQQSWQVETNRGIFYIDLNYQQAPATLVELNHLVDSGFYDHKHFHRFVPNFVIQGGCPRGDGMGGLEYTLRSEFSDDQYNPGTVGIASAGPHTESCQFFISTASTPHLAGRYTVIGHVTHGMDVVESLRVGDEIIKIRREHFALNQNR
jgi:cyclophilin family peptidyl-prolyl cis-trans isomerase